MDYLKLTNEELRKLDITLLDEKENAVFMLACYVRFLAVPVIDLTLDPILDVICPNCGNSCFINIDEYCFDRKDQWPIQH